MSVLWRDVFVPAHVVVSDGLTAELGGVAEMSLELFCRYRATVIVDDRTAFVKSAPGNYTHPDYRQIYDLVGSAVSIESCAWPDGWVIDVGGLAIYVSEADTGPSPGGPPFKVYREAGSDPAMPVPQPGTPIRVRGQLSIAEAYETGGFEPEEDLLRRAVRAWSVRRIVRLDSEIGEPGPPYRGRSQDMTVIRSADLCRGDHWTTTGFLLDLEQSRCA